MHLLVKRIFDADPEFDFEVFCFERFMASKEGTAVHEGKEELCWYHGTFYYGVQD